MVSKKAMSEKLVSKKAMSKKLVSKKAMSEKLVSKKAMSKKEKGKGIVGNSPVMYTLLFLGVLCRGGGRRRRTMKI